MILFNRIFLQLETHIRKPVTESSNFFPFKHVMQCISISKCISISISKSVSISIAFHCV